MKRKILVSGGSPCPQGDVICIAEDAEYAATLRFQRVAEKAFHHGIFVIKWRYDPHDGVAGDVARRRNDRAGSGSNEQP
jgi:hypothetical protein